MPVSARAHTGFLERHPELDLECIAVPAHEKPPAFGSFGFARSDTELRASVDAILNAYIGSDQHRAMMAAFGFSDAEIDLVQGDRG